MTASPRKGRARPAPLSLRLNAAEREALVRRSGNRPLSTYVKDVLFGDGQNARKAPRAVSVDRLLIARALAHLGASGVGPSLAQLAKAAEVGNLYFDDETKARIRHACAEVRAMRVLLMEALGKQAVEPDAHVLGAAFRQATGEGAAR